MTVSAIILSHNNEWTIERAIRSVQWCDEIIVVDDESRDSTVEKAKKLGATVIDHKLNENFAAQRNFGLDKAKNAWVLFIDADEEISVPLRLEIQHALQNADHVAYRFHRLDNFLGTQLKHGETAGVQLIRLAKASAGRWTRPIHETWNVEGSIGGFRHPIFHWPHQSISSLLHKINLYTDIEANHRRQQGKTLNYFELFFFAKAKFFMNYVVKLGFLDGFPGFIMAWMMSLHSFVVRVKMYEH